MKDPRAQVLILCGDNSHLSQMAEALLRAAAGDLFSVQSAGPNPAARVHPMAIKVIREIGVGVVGYRPKHVDTFIGRRIETVITLDSISARPPPSFPGLMHWYQWEIDDPTRSPRAAVPSLRAFRRARDDLALALRAFAAGYRQGRFDCLECRSAAEA